MLSFTLLEQKKSKAKKKKSKLSKEQIKAMHTGIGLVGGLAGTSAGIYKLHSMTHPNY